MIKLSVLLTAAVVASSPAAAETFVRDGVTYVYSVAEHKNTRVISGNDDRGTHFVLQVASNRVVGNVDGRPVNFSLREVKSSSAAQKNDQVASGY